MVQNTLKTALDIHSPSRVMFKLGSYTMEGFEIGLESMYSDTYKSLSTFGHNVPAYSSLGLNIFPRLAQGAIFRGGNPYLAVVNDQPSGQTNIEAPLETIKQD